MQPFHNRTQLQQKRQSLRRDATKAERILWSKIKNEQLGYRFRRQHSIGPFIVDFYCPELRLIIEIDGWVHWEGIQPHKDEKREKYLEKFGFAIVRFTNDKVLYDTDGVLYNLQLICKQLSTYPTRLQPRFARTSARRAGVGPSLSKEGGKG